MRPALGLLTILALTQTLFAGPFYHRHGRIQHEHGHEAPHGHAAVVHMHAVEAPSRDDSPRTGLPALDHEEHSANPAPQQPLRRQPAPLVTIAPPASEDPVPPAPPACPAIPDLPGSRSAGFASRSSPRAPPA